MTSFLRISAMMDCASTVSGRGRIEVLGMGWEENFEPRRQRAHPNLTETGG
jgi:hypothetical protein